MEKQDGTERVYNSPSMTSLDYGPAEFITDYGKAMGEMIKEEGKKGLKSVSDFLADEN